jgi:two-component system KDP operon response regulator KdpE
MTRHLTALLVEDEPQIRRFVRSALESEGFRVHEAFTGRAGLAAFASHQPDLVILDLGLPDRDGTEVLRDLRQWSRTPVIVLSARTEERDKIASLDLGADDYLVKPFGVGELLARVRAALRRSPTAGETVNPKVAFGDIVIDLSAHTVTRAGQAVKLTALEFRLLAFLAANAGKVLTHRNILKEVWGPGHAEDGHYLRIYMSHLRHKLETDPAQPRHLLTETGVGYRFVVE